MGKFQVGSLEMRPEARRPWLHGLQIRDAMLYPGIRWRSNPSPRENDSATLRGLHLDLLTTGDRARVERALETLLLL